ncbi:Protein of unknown function UPF0027 [Beggiatoa sp. PS]|nr:Protein of unknown function UPF0027 [Beggiatoa sp. PS]
MPVKMTLNKGNVPVKIYTKEIDPGALEQLKNIANLPFVHSHIAAMPDVHLGIGATVGAVIPTKGAIIPAAVGVDIGCGMTATRLSIKAKDLPDNLKSVRLAIEQAIPVGFAKHKSIQAKNSTITALNTILEEKILPKHPAIAKMLKQPFQTWTQQLGTLGGGNHFIEVCLDENEEIWIMLHSGSRGIGNIIGRYFIGLAKKDMERYMTQLPHRDLSYFSEGTQYFEDYVKAVHWAQEYALFNRREMMRLILEALRKPLPPFEVTKETISCHHNYVAIEEHFGEQVFLTRKGAISAYEDELGIIPGSMGVKSYIVRGKGNPESFCSCSHGAGRKMSRTEAKRRFNTKDMQMQTQGVECRKDKGVVDEIPGLINPLMK